MLHCFENSSFHASAKPLANRKAALAQFMTPPEIATFMASLFSPHPTGKYHVLDAGAGRGALSRAFLERLRKDARGINQIELDAFEYDSTLALALKKELHLWTRRLPLQANIIPGDFIDHAVRNIALDVCKYTHAILNPPYKKIATRSHHRQALSYVGIETVNLYSGFVAASIGMMQDMGQLVAILPRSFCNGPYYLPFRKYLLKNTSISHIHLFLSRKEPFRNDSVLQENIIIFITKGGEQKNITISTSTDANFKDYSEHVFLFSEVVKNDDKQLFIHIPTSQDSTVLDGLTKARFTLSELELNVSTGPVVDFRLKEHLLHTPKKASVPLLYPVHFRGGALCWPKVEIKKPNAIAFNSDTKKWLYPTGWYTVVRRFSSKEEKKRVVASVVRPDNFPDAAFLGFENHLNVFNINKNGLREDIAYGLAAFLNSSAVDEQFRRFNGHTQVNATDLRSLRYPSIDVLIDLGQWAKQQKKIDQTTLDEQIKSKLQ